MTYRPRHRTIGRGKIAGVPVPFAALSFCATLYLKAGRCVGPQSGIADFKTLGSRTRPVEHLSVETLELSPVTEIEQFILIGGKHYFRSLDLGLWPSWQNMAAPIS